MSLRLRGSRLLAQTWASSAIEQDIFFGCVGILTAPFHIYFLYYTWLLAESRQLFYNG